ncbi:segregation/condensation protein A [Nanoarchaeota archaeon]
MPEEEMPEKEAVSEQSEVSETVEDDSSEVSPEVAAVAVGHQIDPNKEHHENIYDILMKQDEITWQTIIKELIKTDQMDPWDINVSRLSAMFIKTLKKLKEMNLHLSGKILLAAALLLRIKSSRLVGADMMEFDRLLASGEDDDLYSDTDFVEGQLNTFGMTLGPEHLKLVPKTPQPRKRKVSVYDLIDALAIALKVKRRRVLSEIQTTAMDMPEKTIDISSMMDDLYSCVINYLSEEQAERVSFSYLVPGETKAHKIHTFIPLLHLTNARKVDLDQREHFGEIWVSLNKKHQKKIEGDDEGEDSEGDDKAEEEKVGDVKVEEVKLAEPVVESSDSETVSG